MHTMNERNQLLDMVAMLTAELRYVRNVLITNQSFANPLYSTVEYDMVTRIQRTLDWVEERRTDAEPGTVRPSTQADL